MLKIFTTTEIYSLFFSGMLVIAAFCAGCSDEVTPSAQVQMPATTGSQVKFAEGDIIAKSATSTDLYFVILGYDPVTDQYERAFVEKKTDGSWVRSSDTAEFADRDLVEKVYPARVGHVSQVSQISIEAPPENVPFVSATAETVLQPVQSVPTKKPGSAQTLTLQTDPVAGNWTFTTSFEDNGTWISVVCTHQFISGGDFFHSCVSPDVPAQETDYGQWANLGDNSYVIMYPDENHPDEPYGFYDGFYYNLSFNQALDTLTIESEIMNERVVLHRVKNP